MHSCPPFSWGFLFLRLLLQEFPDYYFVLYVLWFEGCSQPCFAQPGVPLQPAPQPLKPFLIPCSYLESSSWAGFLEPFRAFVGFHPSFLCGSCRTGRDAGHALLGRSWWPAWCPQVLEQRPLLGPCDFQIRIVRKPSRRRLPQKALTWAGLPVMP